MSENTAAEAVANRMQEHWERVGLYLSTAMLEVAEELGGKDLARDVAVAGMSDGVLPDPDALRMLENLSPGSAEIVMTRAAEIQQEHHQREQAEVEATGLRKSGRALVDAFAGFNILGKRPRE